MIIGVLATFQKGGDSAETNKGLDRRDDGTLRYSLPPRRIYSRSFSVSQVPARFNYISPKKLNIESLRVSKRPKVLFSVTLRRVRYA